MTTGVYRIGELTNPKPDDFEVYELREAEDIALDMAADDPNLPVAIWDRDEVITLFLNGDQFKPYM